MLCFFSGLVRINRADRAGLTKYHEYLYFCRPTNFCELCVFYHVATKRLTVFYQSVDSNLEQSLFAGLFYTRYLFQNQQQHILVVINYILVVINTL